MLWLLSCACLALGYLTMRCSRLNRRIASMDVIIKSIVLQDGGCVDIKRWAIIQAMEARTTQETSPEFYRLKVVYAPEPNQ